MISNFFIDRPIFASVLSIVITLAGGIALFSLPIAQYPQITPPSISVQINYPGASAQVIADTVGAPIEQQVTGVEHMLFMSSQSGNDGSYMLSVTFDVGTDLNTALVMVQNRVMLAMPLLPTEVQNQGIQIRKRTPDILLVISIYSPHRHFDDIYLSNYALIHINDEVLRLDGVADSHIFGERDYSIRAWLDPQKMAACGINAGDVAAAIRSQNLDVPAGVAGAPPAFDSQPFQVPIDALGRLNEPAQFGDIIVKAGPTSSVPMATAADRPPPARPAPVPPSTAIPLQPAGMSMTSGSTALSALAGAGTTAISALVGGTVSGGTTSASGTTSGGTAGGANSGGGANAAAVAAAIAATETPVAIGTGTMPALSGALSDTDISGAVNSSVAAALLRPLRPSTGIVRLRDIARVEMGAQNYTQAQTFNGNQAVGIAVFQLPGTNALDVAQRVRDKMEELKKRFPKDLDYEIAYDTTPFIRESVMDVVKSFFEAVALVGLVVLAFLQNWRSVLIPMLAVPVAIVGTFAAMAAVGFSLNNISMFGLVLSIGIVVDDAIVVVENVDRWLERGLPPREAARSAMREVTGPIIAMALVLCAVFVPCAFISGITGRFFKQFAVTISVSTVFSAINSLTFSPAMAAILLRPHSARPDAATRLMNWLGGWFFRAFNAAFGRSTAAYAWSVGKLLHVNVLVLLAYAGLLAMTYGVFRGAPKGFVPQQDQGRLLVSIQLPDAASLQRTKQTLDEIDKIARHTPGIAATVTVGGLSFVQQAYGSNFASMFIVLDPFEKRTAPGLRDTAIMGSLQREWAKNIRGAQVIAFPPSPVPGMRPVGGMMYIVEDTAGLGLAALEKRTKDLREKLAKQPGLDKVSTIFRADTPQLLMQIDRGKTAALGIPFTDLNQTLGIFLGSLYVNSFNDFGRHWQVTVQAQGADRRQVSDVHLLEVRNNQGQMVSLGTLVNVRQIGGPIFVYRYNSREAIAVTANLKPGVSSGNVIANVDRLADETLPISMNPEWTDLMFMQIRDGDTTLVVFSLAVMCVFLALAALYESWSLPLAVILVVPLCMLCSVAGVLATHGSVDIFVQIGLVVLVGLACKNSILVVEFARDVHEAGTPRFEATVEAARLRLRPILMTSFAFILGVLPMALATGAGAEMRRSLGISVFSGMLGVTLFGVFLTPVFFYVMQGMSEMRFFASATVQWLGSSFFGGLIGAAMGYVLAQLGFARGPLSIVLGGPLSAWCKAKGLDVGQWPSSIVLGACLGILAGLAIFSIHSRIGPGKKESP